MQHSIFRKLLLVRGQGQNGSLVVDEEIGPSIADLLRHLQDLLNATDQAPRVQWGNGETGTAGCGMKLRKQILLQQESA